MTARTLCVLVLAAASAGAVSVRPTSNGASDGVAIRDAWVRASTERRTSSSGYCRIENATDRPLVLVRITAAGVRAAQVHAMEDHDGQMMMHPVPALTIPAHGAIDLAPGGTHIMLEDITRPLAAGTTLAIQFTFDDGTTRTTSAVVRPFDAVSIR